MSTDCNKKKAYTAGCIRADEIFLQDMYVGQMHKKAAASYRDAAAFL
jgi:hypothetical protein